MFLKVMFDYTAYNPQKFLNTYINDSGSVCASLY